MTKVIYNANFPAIDREQFLTPFDKMFDQIVETAYPKVNVYEFEDKVGLIAEIPGLDKKDLNIEVEDGKLTISGDKHGTFDVEGAKVLRRELKQSSFKRQFELGDLLDGEKIKANFKDGLLSIDIPKIEPKKPKKKVVKIG